MNRGRALLLLCAAPLALGAAKPRLVPDVSQERVEIRSVSYTHLTLPTKA